MYKLPVLILLVSWVFAFSCNSPLERPETISRIDTILKPAMDTALIIQNTDSVQRADSLERKRLRDSFYSLPLQETLITSNNQSPYKQLIAKMLDTTCTSMQLLKTSSRQWYRYNKDQMPVETTTVYRNEALTVRVNSGDAYFDTMRELFINDQKLIPGKNLDTSQCGNWALGSIQFAEDGMYQLRIPGKTYFLLQGFLDQCNGIGCGYVFYLIYDKATHRAVLLEQFRSQAIFGCTTNSRELCILLFDGDDYNSLMANFPFAGSIYKLSKSLRPVPLQGKNGARNFEAYSLENPDTLYVIRAQYQ